MLITNYNDFLQANREVRLINTARRAMLDLAGEFGKSAIDVNKEEYIVRSVIQTVMDLQNQRY